jgi:hypothetical protein
VTSRQSRLTGLRGPTTEVPGLINHKILSLNRPDSFSRALK